MTKTPPQRPCPTHREEVPRGGAAINAIAMLLDGLCHSHAAGGGSGSAMVVFFFLRLKVNRCTIHMQINKCWLRNTKIAKIKCCIYCSHSYDIVLSKRGASRKIIHRRASTINIVNATVLQLFPAKQLSLVH
jgi:hypothetical protein